MTKPYHSIRGLGNQSLNMWKEMEIVGKTILNFNEIIENQMIPNFKLYFSGIAFTVVRLMFTRNSFTFCLKPNMFLRIGVVAQTFELFLICNLGLIDEIIYNDFYKTMEEKEWICLDSVLLSALDIIIKCSLKETCL